MFLDLTYGKARKNAEHLRALGITRIHLSGDDVPWGMSIRCEPGGSHRLDIATSVRFEAEDSETGLSYSWSFDIESRDASGKGYYQIDAGACRRVLRSLRGECRAQFRSYLADCEAKVRTQGDEYQHHADRQYADAAVLRELASDD